MDDLPHQEGRDDAQHLPFIQKGVNELFPGVSKGGNIGRHYGPLGVGRLNIFDSGAEPVEIFKNSGDAGVIEGREAEKKIKVDFFGKSVGYECVSEADGGRRGRNWLAKWLGLQVRGKERHTS